VLRCSINGVNSVAQWGATAALEGPRDHIDAMRGEYAARRDVMLAALAGIDGVRPFVPKGGFYLWCELDRTVYARLGVRDADDLSSRLADAGVGSAPGDAFGESCKDAIRFAYSCSTEMVHQGAPALRALLAGDRGLPGVAAPGGAARAAAA
jgi:aspartate aminotransferase